MALVELVAIDEADSADSAMIESGAEQYGKLLETWKAILNKPGLFATYLPFLRQVAGPGALDPSLKDSSALLVGSLNHCRYTVSHRYASARRNGVSDETLRAVVAGDWAGLNEKLRCALELTTSLTVDPPATSYSALPQAVAETTLLEVKRLFSDEERVELIMSISVWNALSRFHRIMDFELDMPAAPDGIDPQ